MTNRGHTSKESKASDTIPEAPEQHKSLGIDFALIVVILTYIIGLLLHVWSS